jgi:hypothetical protein
VIPVGKDTFGRDDGIAPPDNSMTTHDQEDFGPSLPHLEQYSSFVGDDFLSAFPSGDKWFCPTDAFFGY